MKEEYIAQIVEKLYNCNDLPLLDLISQLLDKNIKEPA